MDLYGKGLWAKGYRHSPRRQTKSTNFQPWGSWSLNQQPKNIRAEPRPSHKYLADVLFDLHVGHKQLDLDLPTKLLPVHGLSFFLVGLPCLALVGEDAHSLPETWSARIEGYAMGPQSLRGEREVGELWEGRREKKVSREKEVKWILEK